MQGLGCPLLAFAPLHLLCRQALQAEGAPLQGDLALQLMPCSFSMAAVHPPLLLQQEQQRQQWQEQEQEQEQ